MRRLSFFQSCPKYLTAPKLGLRDLGLISEVWVGQIGLWADAAGTATRKPTESGAFFDDIGSVSETAVGDKRSGSPGLIRTGGRPINSRMLYR